MVGFKTRPPLGPPCSPCLCSHLNPGSNSSSCSSSAPLIKLETCTCKRINCLKCRYSQSVARPVSSADSELGKVSKPGMFTMKSVKFVGLPPSTSPDSGSPLSTHSLVSSESSSHGSHKTLSRPNPSLWT